MERWLKGVKRVATTFSNEAKCSKAVRAECTAVAGTDDDAATSSSTVSKAEKRKYDESYIIFGFVDSNGSPLCLLCSRLLPNSSMAPAKLRRHLETVHPESKDTNKSFLYVKKNSYWKATEASYLVSYRIAQAGEAHTIAENLIKPCVLDITKCTFDEKSAKHLSKVPLSNDTVSRQIHDLASYVKQEIITHLQKTQFILQIDESTDVAGLAILLVIVKYPYERQKVPGYWGELLVVQGVWEYGDYGVYPSQCSGNMEKWADGDSPLPAWAPRNAIEGRGNMGVSG
ncbi:hypothetical protein K1T71_005615 [Dendrolimus kikuchii]|uniref:Uncharacterized protein n=1 Tax=Dendrolimus kikuchii TaxID=765133 RepID=A0ACC1D4V6_9NEOP|nr:hypothetical protein K1T71_005615 [Dendrolimus kikuchii]